MKNHNSKVKSSLIFVFLHCVFPLFLNFCFVHYFCSCVFFFFFSKMFLFEHSLFASVCSQCFVFLHVFGF